MHSSHLGASLLLACLLTASCGSSDPLALVTEGNSKLGAGDYKSALSNFEDAQKALDGKRADPLYQSAKLGAIEARSHVDAKAAKTEFLDYAKAPGVTLKENDYVDIASKLAGADAVLEALEVIQAGKAAVAGSAKLAKLEETVLLRAKERAMGDSKFKSGLEGLGYLGGG
ncbi:MAG: hypothetical protein FJ299_04975 [Planctomycetes bacterium]|nr:hypothetical protein [Planctomycetota bacterium]